MKRDIYSNLVNEEINIEVAHTEEFIKAAKILNKYIVNLPITYKQKETLINLITNQIELTQDSSFEHGMKFGAEMAKK